jgi:hypothetical protein
MQDSELIGQYPSDDNNPAAEDITDEWENDDSGKGSVAADAADYLILSKKLRRH